MDAYLLGRQCYFLNKLNDAIDLFQKSVAIDPNFARGYSSLARTYGYLGFMGLVPSSAINLKITENVSKALDIDPDEPIAQAVYAAQLFFGEGRYQSALDAFAGLISTQSNNEAVVSNAGDCFGAIGRIDLALECGLRRVELDPFSPRAHTDVGQHYLFLGDYAKADEAFARCKNLGGRSTPFSVDVAACRGDMKEAERMVTEVIDDWPDAPWVGHTAGMYLANLDPDSNQAKYHAQALVELGQSKFIPGGPLAIALYLLADNSWVSVFRQSLADRDRLTLQFLRPEALTLGTWKDEPAHLELRESVALDDSSVANLTVPEVNLGT